MDGSSLMEARVLVRQVHTLMSEGVPFQKIRECVRYWVQENAELPCFTKIVAGNLVVSYMKQGECVPNGVIIPILDNYEKHLPRQVD